jgi:hypothetical protein
VRSRTGYPSLSVADCRTLTITSANLTTLSAQLGQLSKEELHTLLSTQPSATTIASTHMDTTPTPSIRVHATHRPLLNIPVGSSLPTMASSRRRPSTITNHFSHGAYRSSNTTPGVTSRSATITPDTFTGFRTSSPLHTPMTIHSHHGGLNRSHYDGVGLDHSPISIDQSPECIKVRTRLHSHSHDRTM